MKQRWTAALLFLRFNCTRAAAFAVCVERRRRLEVRFGARVLAALTLRSD